MKKMKLLTCLVSLMVLSLTSLPAFAECEGGHCPMKGKGGYQGGHHGRGKYTCPIVGKIMKKSDFYLDHETELGLKDSQVTAIKELRSEVKKSYIRQSAEMKIFQLDLQSQMSEKKVDVEKLNALVDSGTKGMADFAKASIASYAKLKSILSDDQMAKAKELHKAAH